MPCWFAGVCSPEACACGVRAMWLRMGGGGDIDWIHVR